jgi:murein DD-endopeptidase MepM/ murein hydrolase activator NlpD
VLAVASGAVTFSGRVAGTLYVVVLHADGLRVTYGNLASTPLTRGDVVTRGSDVGRTAGRLHLGVRDGDRYIDPTPLIGVLRGVVRLIPADGSASAPAPPPRLRCPAG